MSGWVYNGDVSRIIGDQEQFISVDGTQYPGNYPKNEIAGMQQVVEPAGPAGNLNHSITSSIAMVDGAPTRVWSCTAYTQGELTARAAIAATQAMADTIAAYTSAVQAHMDAVAKNRGYYDVLSACSYAAIGNPFQAESIAFLLWRSACWAACYAGLAAVQAGTRTMPTIPEMIAELPVLVLP